MTTGESVVPPKSSLTNGGGGGGEERMTYLHHFEQYMLQTFWEQSLVFICGIHVFGSFKDPIIAKVVH